jgi:hypothetical protein
MKRGTRAARRLAIGDAVTVNLGRRGGVQEGVVTALLPDGRFRWKNVCNYERTSKPSAVTTEAPRSGKLDPYVQAWVDEGDKGDE